MLVTHHFAWCGVFWGLSALTCAFGGLRFFWVWLLYSFVYLNVLPPLIFGALYSLFWLFPKALCYSSEDYHPSGPEATLEYVRNYNFKQLISPMYFPFNYSYYGSKGFKKDYEGVAIKLCSLFLPVTHYELLIIPSVIMLVLTVLGMFMTWNWLVIATLCLLWTTTYTKFNPRNVIVALPYLAFFLAKGLSVWQIPLQWVNFACIVVIVALATVNRTWLFTQTKCLKYPFLTKFVASLPKDGILSEGLVNYFLAYGSGKRVVAITDCPDLKQAVYETELAIKHFELSYVVTKPERILMPYFENFKLIGESEGYLIYEILVN
jgi:hypothetical protein